MNSGAFPLPKSYSGNFSAPLFPLYDLTLTGTGGWGGGDASPHEFFWNGHRSARRIRLKFCISNGASSFTKLLAIFFWLGQVRSRSYDVISRRTSGRLSPILRFQLRNLLPLTGMETLCVIKVRTWPYLTFDIASWCFGGHPRSLTLNDPVHTNSG